MVRVSHLLASTWLSTAAVLAVGCDDFAPVTRVDNARVLAIIAEPPQVTPDMPTQLQVVMATPEGLVADDDMVSRWWRCHPREDALLDDAAACASPSDVRHLDDGASLSLIVDDALPALDDTTKGDPLLPRLLGRHLVVHNRATNRTGAAPRSTSSAKRLIVAPDAPLDVVDSRLAVYDVWYDDNRRLRPNVNPDLVRVDVLLDDEDVETVGPGDVLQLQPVLDFDTVETYETLAVDFSWIDIDAPDAVSALDDTQLADAFRKVQRCEVPTVSWFVTLGALQAPITQFGTVGFHLEVRDNVNCADEDLTLGIPDNQLVLPAVDELQADIDVVHLFAVLRDGRGGTDVVHRALPFRN